MTTYVELINLNSIRKVRYYPNDNNAANSVLVLDHTGIVDVEWHAYPWGMMGTPPDKPEFVTHDTYYGEQADRIFEIIKNSDIPFEVI